LGFARTRLGSAGGAAELLLAIFRSRPIVGDDLILLFFKIGNLYSAINIKLENTING
jgi:hypothetical protein